MRSGMRSRPHSPGCAKLSPLCSMSWDRLEMTSAHLLEIYERIADAPDAIARLRRFILDLAVRGKLVPQDANDEPAEELLKRIAREKARLVKAGEIKAQKPPLPVEEDADFDVPKSWQWTRLGIVTSYIQR